MKEPLEQNTREDLEREIIELKRQLVKAYEMIAAIPNLNLTISTQSRQDAKILTFPRRNRQEYHLAQGQS
jgi:hypothetical protein